MPISPTVGAAASQANNIGIQDFLRILSSQLSNQDPLKPLDNQEFVTQIAQFSSLQQSQQLNQKVDQLLVTQAATQSVGLLGKSITFTATNGSSLSGQVTGLNLSGTQPQLSVLTSGGATLQGINFSQIVTIH
jgi:flagellar basal-body rod modification protein FlgD